jgi:hypothetical protein
MTAAVLLTPSIHHGWMAQIASNVHNWSGHVAHVLAKSAVLISESGWFNAPPEFILAEFCNNQCK